MSARTKQPEPPRGSAPGEGRPRAQGPSRPGIQALVEKIHALPSVPTILGRVLEKTRDPDATIKELEEIIGQDPGIAAKIVSLANSPYYGFCRRIVTLSNAVALIGLNTVKNLCLSLSVFACFHRPHHPLAGVIRTIYAHSMAAGILVEQLALRSPACALEPAFVAGLFHDIGKLVLVSLLHENYATVLEIARERGEDAGRVEEEVLGFTHARAGALLLDRWNIPTDVVEAVSRHHRTAAGEPALAQAVLVADALLHAEPSSEVWGAPAEAACVEAAARLSLTDADLRASLDEVRAKQELIAEATRA